jgi:pyruvate,water dikinase
MFIQPFGDVCREDVGDVHRDGRIAREYGRPCVVGIDQVTTKLRNGQTVEVDGAAGVVRLRSLSRPVSS